MGAVRRWVLPMGSDVSNWSNLSMAMIKHIGIVLFPDVEELDALGPGKSWAPGLASFHKMATLFRACRAREV
jgi:hypothetical protein